MTPDVPRKRPPYLHLEITRHKKAVWYFQRPGQRRVRIRDQFGTLEFQAQYEAALIGAPAVPVKKTDKASLKWLYDSYRETAAWNGLSPATRRQRENILAGVMAVAGSEPFGKVSRQDIEKGKDRRSATPAQARNFLDAMRGLFRWAKQAQHVSVDPTEGVENPPRQKGPGFAAWDDSDVARYESHWGPGTAQRVWLHVLLYTGLRRGDAVALGPRHVRDGVISINTEKSGHQVEVIRPLLAELVATLNQGPCGFDTFICGTGGRSLTKESFGNLFSAACKAAGVDKSAHGVRKLAATIAAENGATVAELESLFGWSGGTMASLYTRTANRRRLALGAKDKLTRTGVQQSIFAPDNVVRMSGGKKT